MSITGNHTKPWRPFATAAVAMAVVAAGANMPLPLLPRYADAYGLSSADLTKVFAVYTLCIAPALLVFGRLSDARGRKSVLAFALVSCAAASVTLAAAQNVWWLYAGRALQGLSVGAVQGSAIAALIETHPRGDVARAAVAGTVVLCVGTAVGPLTAGVLSEYLPAPLQLCYLVLLAIVLMALTALLVFFPRGLGPRPDVRVDRPSLPVDVRADFLRACLSAVLAWAVTALFLALAPSFLATTLDTDNSVVAGGVIALLLITSALTQLGGRGREPRSQQIAGLVLLVVGLGILSAAAVAESVALCACSAAVAGVGQGLAFSGSARDVSAAAPIESRGRVMSLFFVAIYLSVTVAVVGVGVLSTQLGLLSAFLLFSAVVTLMCAASIASHIQASARR